MPEPLSVLSTTSQLHSSWADNLFWICSLSNKAQASLGSPRQPKGSPAHACVTMTSPGKEEEKAREEDM